MRLPQVLSQFQRVFRRPLGFTPVSIEEENSPTNSAMRRGHRLVDSQCFCGRRLGPGQQVPLFGHAQVGSQLHGPDKARLRQAGMSFGKRRIAFHRLLGKGNRPIEIRRSEFRKAVLSPQIRFVRHWIHLAALSKMVPLFGRDHCVDLPRDGSCGVGVQLEDISEVTIVAFGPEVLVACSAKQLHADAHTRPPGALYLQ